MVEAIDITDVAAANDGLVLRIKRLREHQEALDEKYKILVAQLGAEIYVQTRRDTAFRAPYEDLYKEIEDTAGQCRRNRDRLEELEMHVRQEGVTLAAKATLRSREETQASHRGRHAASTPEETMTDMTVRSDSEKNLSSCPQCGARVDAEDEFCGECGVSLSRLHFGSLQGEKKFRCIDSAASTTVLGRKGKASNGSTSLFAASNLGRLSAIFDLIAIALTFLPWVNLNLYVWSGSYSIPGLIQLAFNANSTATSYLGSSYTNSSISTSFMVTVIIIAVLWFTIVGLLAYDAYKHFVDSKREPSVAAMGGFVFLSLAAVVACFAADAALSEQFASTNLSVSGVVSVSSGAWISIIAGIVFVCYVNMKKDSPSPRG